MRQRNCEGKASCQVGSGARSQHAPLLQSHPPLPPALVNGRLPPCATTPPLPPSLLANNHPCLRRTWYACTMSSISHSVPLPLRSTSSGDMGMMVDRLQEGARRQGEKGQVPRLCDGQPALKEQQLVHPGWPALVTSLASGPPHTAPPPRPPPLTRR
jgi:hypothetical protein